MRVEIMSLKDHTLFITGASRGIGLAIALRAARDGANIAIAAKTDKPHPKLTGTIFTAADEITKAGGNALPLVVDVRDEAQVKDAIEQTVATFGRLDIVVNNASAVQRTSVVDTDMRRFDLMHQVNTRGTLMVSKYAIPHLEKAKNPHILMNSPPLDFREKWFAGSTAYSIAKYGMSLVVLGLAGELRAKGIAVNALWPRATIATAAIKNLLGGERVMRMSRTPAIMADAAYLVFQKPSRSFTGNFLIDDTFLAAEGITDFKQYRADPSEPLARTFFVPDEPAPPPGVSVTVDRWEYASSLIADVGLSVPAASFWIGRCPLFSSPTPPASTISRQPAIPNDRIGCAPSTAHSNTSASRRSHASRRRALRSTRSRSAIPCNTSPPSARRRRRKA